VSAWKIDGHMVSAMREKKKWKRRVNIKNRERELDWKNKEYINCIGLRIK
jgi:hypothetical protein